MRHILILVTIAAAIPGLGSGCREHSGRSAQIEQELIRTEREMAQALIQGDFAFLENVLAPDFVGVNPLGEELSRSEVLARLHSPDHQVDSLRHENIRVRVFGDCAVVLARTVVKGHYQGEETSGEFPCLRVWVRRNGRWQAVATQSTTLPRQ